MFSNTTKDAGQTAKPGENAKPGETASTAQENGEQGAAGQGEEGAAGQGEDGASNAKAPEKPAKKRGKACKTLTDQLLVGAATRIGFVLKPYPKGVKSGEIETALETLKQRGLIHYPAEHPNLTPAGIVAARQLAGIED